MTNTTNPPFPQAGSITPRPYEFDAGDVVILHSLVRSTHVNGRRAVVHYGVIPRELDGDDTSDNVNGRSADSNNDSNNNGDNNNPNENNINEILNRRCMVRLLPAEGSSNNNNSSSTSINSCISVATKNMCLDYPPGQKVILHGLVGARHFNGQIATVVRFQRGSLAKKREPRFLVEVPVHDGVDKKSPEEESDKKLTVDDKLQFIRELNNKLELKGVIGDNTDNKDENLHTTQSTTNGSTHNQVKQILVSPKNIIHIPNTKPPPMPVLSQRLIFTGPMKSIVKLLNQSVHETFTPDGVGVLEGRGFHLLSEDNLRETASVEEERRRAAEVANSAMLWGKIQGRGYRCRGHPVARRSNANNDISSDNVTPDTNEGNAHLLPIHHQNLFPTAPHLGRIHRTCFNPQCHAITNISKRQKMKRCTKCHSVAYCNKHCAMEAWGHHKKCCRVMQEDGVRFADYVTLSSPERESVIQVQRMLRLCVNRVARMDAVHFSSVDSEENNFAKLLYNVMTQCGTDITNEILQMVENPPIKDREVVVGVAFNSLGEDAIYDAKDIQLFANILDCSVTYQKESDNSDTFEDIVSLEPNGEEIQMPQGGTANLPDDVQAGLLNFLNGLVPGGVPPGMMAMAPMGPMNGGAFVMPGMNGNNAPGAGVGDNPNAAGQGGDRAAHENNDNDAAAAQFGGRAAPPGLANFINHVMNEAGIGANENGEENANDADEDLPPMEDVADAPPENGPEPQRPQGEGGVFNFEVPGGEAQIHMAQVRMGGENVDVPPGMVPPMPPPGAFFQVPGMPAGVQVAVAQAEMGAEGGIPPGAFPVPGGFMIPGFGPNEDDDEAEEDNVEEESEMEIED